MITYKKLLPILVVSFIIAIEFSLSFNSVLLPNIQRSFPISDQLASYTISIFLLFLGIAAIIYGGLCDGLGRRPIILLSSFLFCVGTLVSALAPSIEIILVSRFVQGMGAGAGWVVGNASLRDVYSERLYIKVINYVHSIVGIVPAVAPIFGSYLIGYMDWRGIFMLLFFFALTVFILQVFFLPETLKQKKKITTTMFRANFFVVLLNRRYQYFTFIKVISVMILFMDISMSPLMLVNYMGVAKQSYGYYIFPLFAFYVLLTLITEKLLLKFFTPDTVLQGGLGLILLGNMATLGIGTLIELDPQMIQGLKICTYAGFGMIYGTATGCLVDAVYERAGSGAAIMIALEMLASAFGIAILSFYFDGTYVAFSVAVVFIILTVFFLTNLAKRNRYVSI